MVIIPRSDAPFTSCREGESEYLYVYMSIETSSREYNRDHISQIYFTT